LIDEGFNYTSNVGGISNEQLESVLLRSDGVLKEPRMLGGDLKRSFNSRMV